MPKQKLILACSTALLLVLSGCTESANHASPEPGSSRHIAFYNVRVLPMTGEWSLENHTVVVSDGRIEQIGPTATTQINSGTYQVDGSGLTILPGLADMHVHYWHKEDGPLFLLNGVTTVRNLWGTSFHFRLDDLAKSGKLAGPNVYTSGPLIDGPNPIWGEWSVVVDSPAAAEGAVDSQHATGYTAIKLYEQLDPDSFRMAVAAAKQRKMQVYAHTPKTMTVDELIDLKVDSIEHLDGYELLLSEGRFDPSSEPPPKVGAVAWTHADQSRMDEIARRTADAGIWNIPTLTINSQLPEYLATAETFFDRAEIQYVAPATVRSWRQFAANSESWLRVTRAGDSSRKQFVKMLFDSGAQVLVGTDTSNPFIVPGFSFHEELENLSEAGIPNDALLRSATATPAHFLQKAGEFGVIAVGARADLILVDGDPTTNLSVLREPVGMMVNGHWRTREQIIQILDANAEKFDQRQSTE